MDNGIAAQNYVSASGRNIIDVPFILDSVIADYSDWGIDILLIPGDLTKDGEKQSHTDLKNKLDKLVQKGTRIFVIPGNHDINMPNPVGYRGNGSFPVENISPEDFETIYTDFGYASAIKRDSVSLSYVAEIDKNIWLLAIDACRYKEYTTHSISAGRITSSTEEWILDVLKEANQKGIKLISMMHHGLVEHIMYQGMLLPQYLVDDWQRLAQLFADNSMKIIFTGHSHANDITEFSTNKGKILYDIETGALCSYPFPYRFITLNNEGAEISTKNITSIPQNPNLSETNKKQLRNLAQRLAIQKIKDKSPDIPSDIVSKIAEIVGKVFILHAKGDEVIDDDLKNKIQQLAQIMDMPIDLSPEYFQLDYPPADNNLKIRFFK